MVVSPAGLAAMRKAARRWLGSPEGLPAIVLRVCAVAD